MTIEEAIKKLPEGKFLFKSKMFSLQRLKNVLQALYSNQI
jgi:hypothetical protein